MPPAFGVNLNNREPLVAPGYSLADLLDLAELTEQLGFQSVWVGDSLFSKPRFEALSLLSALTQRTADVALGTACLVLPTRNPLYLALEWATLDHLSGGRTIFGACMGSPEKGVRREFDAVGLPFAKRASIFEEALAVVRQLWTSGRVTFRGEYFEFVDIAFESGTEPAPLMPIQQPPPTWVVSNPGIATAGMNDETRARMRRAARRIVTHGEGWMTCCRARHPEELEQQLAYLHAVAGEAERDLRDFQIAYQVTMNLGESAREAGDAFSRYIREYYPELSQKVDLADWGPTGTPDDIAAWLQRFADLGVTHFICRFGDLDQFGQLERFAREVLPRFRGAVATVDPSASERQAGA